MLQGRSIDCVPASHNSVLQDMLDLRPYIDSIAAAVQESFALERTYVVFRTLGLRDLVVVDRHNHVKGMITRKASSAVQCLLHRCDGLELRRWQYGMAIIASCIEVRD